MLTVSVLVGIATSVAGGYLYAYLVKTGSGAAIALPLVGIVLLVTAAALRFRGKWYLLRSSGIRGYYPNGQGQCQRKIQTELRDARRVVFVGARGMDLVGEGSPFSQALLNAKNLEKVEVFLLVPGGKNSRLRSEHLEVERNKYAAESAAVEGFLGSLALRQEVPIDKYSYTEKPSIRLIDTGRTLWVAYYKAGVRGRNLPVFALSRPGVLAREIERRVDALRAGSELSSFDARTGEPEREQ